jgi:hypothetical protein
MKPITPHLDPSPHSPKRRYLTGCADLPCTDLKSWSQIVQAVLAQVTQVAHQAVITPSKGASQRRVALLLTPDASVGKALAQQLRSVNQALGVRLRTDFAVISFRIKQGDKKGTHQLSWSGF